MRHVTLVRPYGHRIRDRVVRLLARAGLGVRDGDVIPKGTSDDEVLERLRARPPDVLLVPFHAHKDAQGDGVNGLDLVERLGRALPELDGVPIIMPASMMALPAARLRLSSESAVHVDEALANRILLLSETDLESPESVAAVVRHTTGS